MEREDRAWCLGSGSKLLPAIRGEKLLEIGYGHLVLAAPNAPENMELIIHGHRILKGIPALVQDIGQEI